jgi:hypothetical protein
VEYRDFDKPVILVLSARVDQKRVHTMHDLLIAGGFIMMVLAPCLVAMRTGAMDDQEG